MKKAVPTNRQDLAQQGRMVGKQAAFDFLNPVYEWRRVFAETWGTFLPVLVAAGGGVVAVKSGGAVTLARIFHQDAEIWRRTGRDRSGSTGAAN